MVELDRTRRGGTRSSKRKMGNRLMEFADEGFEDATNDNTDRGMGGAEEGSDDKTKEDSVKQRGGGASEDDEDLFDTGDEDDDDDEDYEEKPWQRKRAKPDSKGSNVSDNTNNRQPNDIPKKKKQKVENNIKEDGNQKLNKPNAEIRNNSKVTNKISDIKKNNNDKKPLPSLIANMVPKAANKDKSYHRITDWKPQEEYLNKKQSRHNKPTSSSGTPSSISRQKGQSPTPSSQQDRKGSSSSYAKENPNKSTTKTTKPSSQSQQLGVNNNNHVDALKSERERNEKITKDLSKLIEKVVESKGKSSSSTAIEDLLQPPDFLGGVTQQDNMPKSPMRDGASTSDKIDWNGSFIPRTDEERYDFFERDEKGRIKKDNSNLRPMFPEDFKRGQKEWPLQWWGIIPAPREIEAMHETERPTSRSSSERRNGHGRSRSSDRRGGNGGSERDNYRENRGERDRGRDRDRDRDRGGDRERGSYDQHHHAYPPQGGHEGNGPDRSHGYGNFHNYPPAHFHDRFPPHGRGAGPPGGWQQGHRQDDAWYGRNFPEGGGRGFGGRGGPGPNWGRGGGSGWGGPGGPPRRPMG